MNLPTLLICIGLGVGFFFAVRHLMKKGTCAGCSEKDSCHAHCSGGCTHCVGHDGEESNGTKA